MPIDKLTPRQLDADSDSKLVKKTAMLDALNLYSGDTGGSGGDGDMGVLKNIKGNVQVIEAEALPDDARVIGKVEDKKTSLVYLFVYSETAADQGVWVFDPEGRLPGSPLEPSLRLVYKSKYFNFPQNGFVKADIIQSNATTDQVREGFNSLGVDFEKDAIIYFTDNTNEPRKINAYRAFLSAGSAIHGDDVYAEADFITACPKVPLSPITFYFDRDDTRSISNFTTTPGMQFAYQHVYIDGMESAISPYSDIAFPPSVVNQGSLTYMDHVAYNRCVLKVPKAGPEIASVKIVARQGNTGSFFVIEQVDVEDIADFEGEGSNTIWKYNFYNDRITTGVSTDETNKQFDALPRIAEAQSLSSNRLMYANYLEGFDNVKIPKTGETSCEVEIRYKEKPEDFLTFDMKVTPSIAPHSEYSDESNSGKSVGFVLDFTEIPSSIPAETEITVGVTVAPDQNWHLYRYEKEDENVFGYHQTRQLGPQEQGSIDNVMDGVNFAQSFAETNEAAGATGNFGGSLYDHAKYFSTSTISNGAKWRCVDFTGDQQPNHWSQDVSAKYGTSAANPLILKGGAVSFSVKLKTLSSINDNARAALNSAVKLAFDSTFSDFFLNYDNLDDAGQVVNPDGSPGPMYELGFEILERNREFTSTVNVGLSSGDLIRQAAVGQGYGNLLTDPEAKLIVGVKLPTGASFLPKPPGGYFLVNKAKPVFALKDATETSQALDGQLSVYGNERSHFKIHLEDITDIELLTCIHPTVPNDTTQQNGYWIVISKSDMEAIESASNEPYVDFDDWLDQSGLGTHLEFHQQPITSTTTNLNLETWANQIGYLKFTENNFLKMQTSGLRESNCLMDGEGGPGGGPSNTSLSPENPYDKLRLYNQGSVTVNPIEQGSDTEGYTYSYASTVFYGGHIRMSNPNSSELGYPTATTLPLLFLTGQTSGGDNEWEYVLPQHDPSNTGVIDPLGPNFKRLQSPAEILTKTFSVSTGGDDKTQSFKTEANHDFGIIYYDERGRHGFVNPLATAFVEGYSDAERPDGNKGRAEIKLTLNHDPPSWAHYYKIAYSKNTTVDTFVQYSAGGAFTPQNDEDQEVTEANKNIYVSLNYLQHHPVSYVSSFGARTPEGGLNFYKFQAGDRLRVISYFEGEDRVYRDIEFDVVDLVDLGDGVENPLEANPTESQKGHFVVLKNNPEAFGFSFGDVDANVDKWGDNCIIELRRPRKDIDEDKKLYYEMEKTYPVVELNGSLLHGHNPIVLDKGDVWFRRVAVNVRDLNEGQYEDIILDDDNFETNNTHSNFKNVYLETETATDLFRADSLSTGRPNAILEGAIEARREASITYSDPSNPEAKKINYASFNSSLANFKDLPEKYGSINYINDHGDFLFVLQEDKASRVPVNRNVLSDVSGTQNIIASKNVLNEAIFYPGENGCDGDPSSISDIDETVFFANKSLGKVYRYRHSKGVEVVSDLGVASLFRNMFKEALALTQPLEDKEVRVVGGYDPVKEEYLITVVEVEVMETSNPGFLTQPSANVQGDGDPEDDDGDGDAVDDDGDGDAVDDDDGGGGGGGDDDDDGGGDDDVSQPSDDDGPKPIVIDDSGFYPG